MKDYPAGSATSISILCREVNRYTGEIAVYLCKKNVDGGDLQCCGIRARVNPELRYYATDTRRVEDAEDWEEIVHDLKRRNVEKLEKALQDLGIIVKL